MLTSIFNDDSDSNEPLDSKRNINNYRNNQYPNNNPNKNSNIYNTQYINNINDSKCQPQQKVLYQITNNTERNNDNYYNISNEQNSMSPSSKQYKNIHSSRNPYKKNNNEDYKDYKNSQIINKQKLRINPNIINIDNNSDEDVNNNELYKNSYKIKDYKNENLIKNEYYIKYVTLNRQAYEFLHDRNYLSALLIFQKCQDLSKNYLKDELKEINSLINMSICEYYNGNFSESYTVIAKAKIIYDSLSLEGYNISTKQRLQLIFKLFINSSLANLSVNKYEESKNDILFLISTIRKESDINKQFLYYRAVVYTLFKVESLINYDIEINNSINNLNTYNMEMSEPIKIINNLMNDFLRFLKEKNFGILLNTFKEASKKYKKLNDFNGYYFSLFYHYLVLYNEKRNNFENDDLEEIKKNISICNNQLIGNELVNQIKEKDINKLLKEFLDKINCACEIFELLEKFENELNKKLKEYDKEKNINIENENDLSYSHLLDKSHLFTNEKINSPIFVKLLLRYSANFLKQKKKAIQNENSNNQDSIIENYDNLIKEVELIQQKIDSNEINIENIKLHQLDKEMINSLKQLFDNLIYINYKSKLYRYFKNYKNKIYEKKNSQILEKILDFLSENLGEIIKGVFLFKINYKTKGYKAHFYKLNKKNYTLNIYQSEKELYPEKTISLLNDVIKIEYGIKSKNLKKKLLSKDKDARVLDLLRCPWKFISIITHTRSIDLHCNDEELNYMFYGLKSCLIRNNMGYKINSTTYFVINKIKLKISLIIKHKYKDKDDVPSVINKLNQERAIQTISFTKLFLLFNKYKKIKNN